MRSDQQNRIEKDADHSPRIRKAHFHFYEELNDYLSPSLRKRLFAYEFKGSPTIKDTIQAIGVPHGEIDLILINGQSVDFDYHLKGDEKVSVYPVFETLDISPLTHLRPAPLRKIKFIVDVNLGKLAGKLRLLGFDTYFRNDLGDEEIIQKSVHEKRIILTRDMGILKQNRVTHGYFLRTDDPERQVYEVADRFQLKNLFNPFSRCAVCNGSLEEAAKNELEGLLREDTLSYYNKFWKCSTCNKIYWQGSHFKHILSWIDSLKA